MSLEIITPIADIERMILREFCDVANSTMPALAGKLKREIANNIGDIFEFSPEYHSLATGMLQAHFGLPKGESVKKLKAIITTLAESTYVDFVKLRPRGNNIDGGFRVYAFLKDFSDILSLYEAYQITEKGQSLPWLEWFLTEGERMIIIDYFFHAGSFGRSGGGIMVKKAKSKWGVPAPYYGTKNDNWITRTVNAYVLDIEVILEQAFKKVL